MKKLLRDLAVKRRVSAFYTGGLVAWSSDGTRLFATCGDLINVINLENDEKSYVVGQMDESAAITAFCPDDAVEKICIAYTAGIIREIRLPSPLNAEPLTIRTWKSTQTAPILQMKYDASGTKLATGSADHTVKIWDVGAQQCTHTLKGSSVVSALLFSPYDHLMVGYLDGTVNVYDLTTAAQQKLIKSLSNHSSQITSLLLVEKPKRVLIVSRDQTASTVDLSTLDKLRVLPLFESVEDAAIGPKGELVTVGEEGSIKTWTVDGAKLLKSQKLTGSRLDQILFSPTARAYVCVSAEHTLFLVNASDLSVKRQFVGYNDEIFSMSYLGPESSLLAVGANSTSVRVYNTQNWDCVLLDGHTESVLCVDSASWDRTLLASSSKDNSFILWRVETSEREDEETRIRSRIIARATGHTNSVSGVKLSTRGKKPFIVSVANDMTLKLWKLEDEDLKSETEVKLTSSATIVAHTKDITCVGVSSNDELCVTGSMDKTAKLWRIDNKKWKLTIGGTLDGHRRGVWDAKFAPNAQKVLTCSGDYTVKIFSLSDLSCQHTFAAHTSAVLQVEFVANGQQFISADSGGILRLWTVNSGEVENTFEGHDDKIWTMCVKDGGEEMVTAGTDGQIIVWKNVTEEKRAEEEATRREKIQQEQALSNLLEQRRFGEALEYALTLERPRDAMRALDGAKEVGDEEVVKAISGLEDKELQLLLDYASQWNTNNRSYAIAQSVVNAVLLTKPPEVLLELPCMNAVVQALIPYSQRHTDRLTKIQQDVSILEFTWKQMRIG